MTTWDVPAIRDLMLESGKIALRHFDDPEIATKDDASIVTAADQEIEEMLRGQLAPGTDDAAFIGEESVAETTAEAVEHAVHGRTWIVDPIDGTAPYANGLPNWGISLGFMENGRFADGAIFLPRIGELYVTDGSDVLFERGPRDPDYWRFEDLKPVASREIPFRRTGMLSLPSEIAHRAHFDGRNPFQAIGSAVYSVAKVLSGSYLCYIARVKLWDIGGSIPILTRLGFRIETESGRVLPPHLDVTDWILDAGSPRIWKSRELLFIGRSAETVATIRSHFTPRPRERT